MDESRAPTYAQCFKSMAVGLAPLFILFGIAAIFGADTVRINRLPVHGPLALLYSVVMALLLAALCATFQKLGYFILSRWPRREADVEA